MFPIDFCHIPVSIIKRSAGRSAVAAAAYRSGTKLTNEWDGMTHDYTRKGGIVHAEIMLPAHPPEFADRSILWNSVEQIEKARDSQLAREIEAALPRELSGEQQLALVRAYVKDNFVDKGMCADFAIHDKGTGNPHVHIMLTLRPLKEMDSGAQSAARHTIWTRMDSVSRMGKAAGKIIGRIRPTGTIKEMWRFGGQRGQPTPTGHWNLPVDRSVLTTAATSGRALIKFPLSIWGQLPAKWKSAVSAPTRGK